VKAKEAFLSSIIACFLLPQSRPTRPSTRSYGGTCFPACFSFSLFVVILLLCKLFGLCMQINGPLAHRAIKELMAKGTIRLVAAHANQQIYTRATNT